MRRPFPGVRRAIRPRLRVALLLALIGAPALSAHAENLIQAYGVARSHDPRLKAARFEFEAAAYAEPPTEETRNVQGPFLHRPGDDDSAAVTFWGKRDLRTMLRQALALLDAHYAPRDRS